MATRIWPNDYYEAAAERAGQAYRLYHDDEAFGPSLYLSGVASECMIRAYLTLDSEQFDSRHDLSALFRECDLSRFGRRRPEISAAVSIVHKTWANDAARFARFPRRMRRREVEPSE